MKRIFALLLSVSLFLLCQPLPAFGSAANTAGTIEENGFVCELLDNGSLKLVRYTGKYQKGGTVNIPDTVHDYLIKCIGTNAFDGCKMGRVMIPSHVEMIEVSAFNHCTELDRITIPNSVIFIDGNPFTGCYNLQNISVDPKHPTLQTLDGSGCLYSKMNKMMLAFPYARQSGRSFTVQNGTVAIGKYAFYGCDKLEAIVLPNTVKTIGDGAFMLCSRLSSISLPESLLTVGELAFAGCSKLRSISIPSKVTRIERSTFFNCDALQDVKLAENTTDICDFAFMGCKTLGAIHLPMNVRAIGENAFKGCQKLIDVYVPVTVTQMGDHTFEGCSPRLTLHLAESSYSEIYYHFHTNEITITYDTSLAFLEE